MSLSSFLPQAKEPGQILNESAANVQSILASILAGKQNQQKISQKEMANQQLNEYRKRQLEETKIAHQQMNDYRMQLLNQKKQDRQDLINQKKEEKNDALRNKIEEKNIERNLKTGDEIEESTYPLIEVREKLKRAKEILEKSDVTGPVAGRAAKWGLSNNEDIATLDDIFGDVQTLKARLAGTKGGAQLMNIVKGFKPDVTKYGKYNLAMINSILTGLDANIETNKKRYKSKTNKDLELFGNEGSSENTVNYEVKDGKLVEVK